MTETQSEDFELARQLLLWFFYEDDDESRMALSLLAVREKCSVAAFHRLLVLAEAVRDPRFDEYGAADVLPILRNMEITNDLNGDVERLLESMRLADIAAFEKAEREAASINDPFRRAAIRLLTKFRNPNLEQV